MFSGTVVCGNIIKLLKGKTGIILGNSFFHSVSILIPILNNI